MGFLDKISDTREALGKVLRREKKADEDAPEPGGNALGASGNTSRDSLVPSGGTPSVVKTTLSVFASPTPAPEALASPQSNHAKTRQLASSRPRSSIGPLVVYHAEARADLKAFGSNRLDMGLGCLMVVRSLAAIGRQPQRQWGSTGTGLDQFCA